MGLLGIEGLSISFGGLVVLSDVSLTVGVGEIVGLIGPNGAGKTTVFNILSGLYAPSAGRAVFDGVDLTRLAPHEIARRGIGRTFQNTEVFRALSALDNVLVGEHAPPALQGCSAAACGLPAVRREEAAARERARALLARVGLSDVAEVAAGSLPLGSQKRLEMARALAARPRLLLLDEPAGGLNPTETRTLMDLIRRLRDELALTIMLVEHDMELVMSICDQVTVLHHGRTIATGPPRDDRRRPGGDRGVPGNGRRRGAGLMLELTDLSVAYGQRRALHGVSLTVNSGEIVTLLGANGSGKSTTLRAISGLVRPSGGTIRWHGRDLARSTADAIVVGRHRPRSRRAGHLRRVHRAREPAGRRPHRRGPRGPGPARGGLRIVPRAGASAAASSLAHCPAASSRCWPSAGRS